MVFEEVADFGLATESLDDFADLVTLPCYAWQHVLVLPAGHPLAQLDRVSIEDLAPLPLISYHPSFSGRKRIDAAFATRKLVPNIVLEAIDADVIKTYVRLGLGVGIVAEIAMREEGAGRRPGRASGRPPVRPERHPHRLQARRLPAQLRLCVRRDDVRPPDRGRWSSARWPATPHDYQL